MIQRAFVKIQVTILNTNNGMILQIVSEEDTYIHTLINNILQLDWFLF